MSKYRSKFGYKMCGNNILLAEYYRTNRHNANSSHNDNKYNSSPAQNSQPVNINITIKVDDPNNKIGGCYVPKKIDIDTDCENNSDAGLSSLCSFINACIHVYDKFKKY